jgi:hypothetical protein
MTRTTTTTTVQRATNGASAGKGVGADSRVYYTRDAKGNVYERRMKPVDLTPTVTLNETGGLR